ncbi:MAG: glycosyltransferase [Deltaproteobacteria bacterium]|nr:glycosyltransferase [Deltaproteobacteria bacterium]
MRVIHVLHSMTFGGAEVLVHDFLKATRDRLSQVVVCLDGIGPLGESLRADGVRVEVLGRTSGLQPQVAIDLHRLIADVRPDVVCAHQYTPYSYAAMALGPMRHRPGLVFVEHGRHYPDVRRPKRVVANNLVFLQYTRRVVAVCGYIKRLLVENEGIPASRIDVVYNGVDPSRFDPSLRASLDPAGVRSGLGLDPSAQVITCVARFHPVKDHPTLVRAFSVAARELPHARLLLVGGGDEAPLRALASELGVGDRVVFAGVRRDIPAIYAASDLFAMASLSEGTSVTLLEAMLSERPALVTEVGGNPEIVAPGVTGELVPRGDHAAMGAAMVALLRDPERRARMGAAGRRRVLDRFTQQRMHEGWVGALQDAAVR